MVCFLQVLGLNFGLNWISKFSEACYNFYLYHPNNIWRTIQILSSLPEVQILLSTSFCHIFSHKSILWHKVFHQVKNSANFMTYKWLLPFSKENIIPFYPVANQPSLQLHFLYFFNVHLIFTSYLQLGCSSWFSLWRFATSTFECTHYITAISSSLI